MAYGYEGGSEEMYQLSCVANWLIYTDAIYPDLLHIEVPGDPDKNCLAALDVADTNMAHIASGDQERRRRVVEDSLWLGTFGKKMMRTSETMPHPISA
jgi:hypothetical protein